MSCEPNPRQFWGGKLWALLCPEEPKSELEADQIALGWGMLARDGSGLLTIGKTGIATHVAVLGLSPEEPFRCTKLKVPTPVLAGRSATIDAFIKWGPKK